MHDSGHFPLLFVGGRARASNDHIDGPGQKLANFQNLLNAPGVQPGMHGRECHHLRSELLSRLGDVVGGEVRAEEPDTPAFVRGDDPGKEGAELMALPGGCAGEGHGSLGVRLIRRGDPLQESTDRQRRDVLGARPHPSRLPCPADLLQEGNHEALDELVRPKLDGRSHEVLLELFRLHGLHEIEGCVDAVDVGGDGIALELDRRFTVFVDERLQFVRVQVRDEADGAPPVDGGSEQLKASHVGVRVEPLTPVATRGFDRSVPTLPRPEDGRGQPCSLGDDSDGVACFGGVDHGSKGKRLFRYCQTDFLNTPLTVRDWGANVAEQNLNKRFTPEFDTMFKKILVFALFGATLAVTAPEGVQAQDGDIVAVAQAAGGFETLLAAATAADLVATLQGAGPFTVFAPTDEAFAKIPQEQLQALLENKDALRKVLLYHVVPGRVEASQVVNLTSAETAAGQNVSIMVENGAVKVDNANVMATDIQASNGVIHVIDQVILPEM